MNNLSTFDSCPAIHDDMAVWRAGGGPWTSGTETGRYIGRAGARVVTSATRIVPLGGAGCYGSRAARRWLSRSRRLPSKSGGTAASGRSSMIAERDSRCCRK